jgi:hypothetical protein
MRKPVTVTPSSILAPCIRAPLASDWVMSEGLACPSVGSHDAPIRSEVSISGHIRFTSSGADQVHLHPEAFRGGGKALELGPAVGGGGQPQAAGHLPAGVEAGLGGEALVEIDRIFQHLGDRGRGAQAARRAPPHARSSPR